MIREAESTFTSRQFAIALTGCCLIAGLVRLVHVLQTIDVPTSVQPLGDSEGYLNWASRIVGGDWYGQETFYQAPLYPYFLAVCVAALGHSLTAIRLVQSLLGVVGVGLIGIATGRWFGRPAGLIAALGMAIYPPAIYYDGTIQKASLASFLLCSLLGLLAFLDNRRRVFLAGFVLALLSLTRENAILWIPVLIAWLMVRGMPKNRESRGGFWRIDWWSKLRACFATSKVDVAVFCLGLAVVFVPVAARNASLGGEWSPTTFQSGPNFYIGNGLQANGVYRPLVRGHETPFYERGDAHRLAEQAEQRSLTDRQVSRYWMHQALGEIAEDPWRWVQLMVTKLLMTINAYEVPDVESMRVYQRYSVILNVLSRFWNFGWLFPLAITGAWLARRQNVRSEIANQPTSGQSSATKSAAARSNSPSILLWLAMTMVLAVTLFFVLGRYRYPLVPLLMPLAAWAIVVLPRSFRSPAKPWSAVMVFVIAWAVCRIPVHDIHTMESTSLMNAGISAARLDHLGEATHWFRQAVRESPEIAETRFNYGKALLKANQLEPALVELIAAKRLAPDMALTDRHLGECLAKMGRLKESLAAYEAAVINDRDDEAARSMIRQLHEVLRASSSR